MLQWVEFVCTLNSHKSLVGRPNIGEPSQDLYYNYFFFNFSFSRIFNDICLFPCKKKCRNADVFALNTTSSFAKKNIQSTLTTN